MVLGKFGPGKFGLGKFGPVNLVPVNSVLRILNMQYCILLLLHY